jgi:hypothetical protein
MDIPMPPQGDNDHRDKAKEKMVRLQRYGVTVGTIDVLREMIFSQTHIYLGISSLRRIFQFQEDYGDSFRKGTMDTLAQFLGFRDWNEACPDLPKKVETSVIFERYDCYSASSFLSDSELTVETECHQFCLRKLEGNQFEVISVEGSNSIKPHDILEIPTFYKGNHFLVNSVVRNSVVLGSYDSRDNIINIEVTD